MNGATEKVLARLGIYRIELPNPFSTDKINCYFIEGSSPTLIDTAIATDEAYDSLSRALSRIGRSVGDIGRIILTHGHADHRALAPRIRDASAAEVFCHPLEADKVTQASAERKALSRGKTADFFRSMGVPEVVLPTLVKGPQSPFVKPRLDCASFLREGDQIRIDDLSLRTLH
ncbi:MAG: MBL fold metallo-hydrolase, partial [Candidatus Hydrogenedentota bacterium]